jgi:small subunit ribosomal protein S2e
VSGARFKAIVAVGDYDGHLGIGVKASTEIAEAVKGATLEARTSVRSVCRGFWGSPYRGLHTVAFEGIGRCGSVTFHVRPAPRGCGIVGGRLTIKLMLLAGIQDVFTSIVGESPTTFSNVIAIWKALTETVFPTTSSFISRGAPSFQFYSSYDLKTVSPLVLIHT